jgi:mRNA interferase RelE/StbE
MNLFNFEIVVDAKAERDIRKLKKQNNPLLKRLIETIDNLSFNPYQGKPLTGSKKGCYSIRVSDYRIIYEIYTKESIVHIIRVGHRKEVYR